MPYSKKAGAEAPATADKRTASELTAAENRETAHPSEPDPQARHMAQRQQTAPDPKTHSEPALSSPQPAPTGHKTRAAVTQTTPQPQSL